MLKKITALLLFGGLLISIAGCGIMDANINALLKAPRANNVQRQLRTAIDVSIGTNLRYVTPSSGGNRTSLIMTDLNNDGRQEAVVFYMLLSTGEVQTTANIAVFTEQSDGSWVLTKQISGRSESIDYVEFADFNSDGYKDILIGWISGQGTARELFAYDLKAQAETVIFTDAYNESRLFTDSTLGMFILTLTMDKSVGSGVAKIMALDESGSLREHARCAIDTHFDSFANISYSRVSADTKAIILDGRQGNNAVTQVLFYDGARLTNPLSRNGAVTGMLVRETSFNSADIDKDGIIEFPALKALPDLPGVTATNTASVSALTRANVTAWSSLDMGNLGDDTAPPLAHEFYCVMNSAFKYYYIIPPEWIGQISAYLNTNDYSLAFYHIDPLTDESTLLFSLHRLTAEEYQRRADTGSWYQLHSDASRVYAINIASNLSASHKLFLGRVEDSRGRLILYS